MDNKPVKFVTVTPVGNAIEMHLKRWWQTREFWVSLATIIGVIMPFAIANLDKLELGNRSWFAVMIVLLCIREVIGLYLKNTSTSVVVSKPEMEAAKENIASGAVDPTQPITGT